MKVSVKLNITGMETNVKNVKTGNYKETNLSKERLIFFIERSKMGIESDFHSGFMELNDDILFYKTCTGAGNYTLNFKNGEFHFDGSRRSFEGGCELFYCDESYVYIDVPVYNYRNPRRDGSYDDVRANFKIKIPVVGNWKTELSFSGFNFNNPKTPPIVYKKNDFPYVVTREILVTEYPKHPCYDLIKLFMLNYKVDAKQSENHPMNNTSLIMNKNGWLEKKYLYGATFEDTRIKYEYTSLTCNGSMFESIMLYFEQYPEKSKCLTKKTKLLLNKLKHEEIRLGLYNPIE